MPKSLETLNARFNIPGVVSFELEGGALPKLAAKTPHARAELCPYGAHVTHYQPSGQKPVLFMSRRSHFAEGKPIRGGVPVVFPWFADNLPQPASPVHGFARTNTWDITKVHLNEDESVSVQMQFESNDATRSLWPHDFQITHTVKVGPTLSMTFDVINLGDQAFTFEQALHTYLYVHNVPRVTVTGLAATTYLDKTDTRRTKTQDSRPIQIEGETDRVYQDTRAPCVVEDPGLGRRITVRKSGSDSTVLWNPWVEKATKMNDFGDHEWPNMLCIETANVGHHAVKLEPGESHRMQAVLEVKAL